MSPLSSPNGPVAPRDRRAATADGPPSPDVVRNVAEDVRLEQRDQLAMSRSARIASVVTAFSGSMVYVWLHVVWFAGWILINLGLFGLSAFDALPFGLLTMIVSLEAIFLSTFVLISQNRQALAADRRAKVDLQVNLVAVVRFRAADD